MMDNLIDSELISKYRYAIISDSRGIIFCKQKCVPVVAPLKESFAPCYPTPHDYMEDFSICYTEDGVSFYIGDIEVITLKLDEMKMIMQHIQEKTDETND